MKRFFLILSLIGYLFLIGCKGQEKTLPQRKDIVDVVFASGNIVTEDQRSIASLSEGYLVESFVKEGDSVTVGQTLFHIYGETQKALLESSRAAYHHKLDNLKPNSTVFQELNAQRIQIKNKLETDSLNFLRFQNLIQSNAVSRTDYDKSKLAYENSRQDLRVIESRINDTKKNMELDLMNAKANLISQQDNNSYFTINSWVNGVVFQIAKTDGELVKKGELIAEIGSGDFIAKLQISEEDINRVQLGQDVFIELNTDKNNAHKAKITKIYPALDTKEQSFIAEAKFEGSIRNLKSGTQLQANIVIQEKKNALVIPTEYLLPNDYVMVRKRKEKTKVQIGIKTTEGVEILQGLDENTTIVLPE